VYTRPQPSSHSWPNSQILCPASSQRLQCGNVVFLAIRPRSRSTCPVSAGSQFRTPSIVNIPRIQLRVLFIKCSVPDIFDHPPCIPRVHLHPAYPPLHLMLGETPTSSTAPCRPCHSAAVRSTPAAHIPYGSPGPPPAWCCAPAPGAALRPSGGCLRARTCHEWCSTGQTCRRLLPRRTTLF
jgi:hypothetical protein